MATPVTLSPLGIQQFFNNQGQLNVGGSILTQVASVNTTTYEDAAGTIPLPNPIPLNSRGEISNAAGISKQLFLQTGVTYTFTQFDALGNQLNQALTISTVTSVASSQLADSTNAAFGAALIGNNDALGYAAGTLGAKTNNLIFVTDNPFNAVAGDSVDCLAAFQAAYTACVGSGKTLIIPGGTYKMSGSWTISNSGFRCIPLGVVTLHFSGAGQGLIFSNGGTAFYDVTFGGAEPINVKGNAATTDVVMSQLCHHSTINVAVKDGVTGLRVNGAVATKFVCECSVNTGAFVLTPTNGMVLDSSGGVFTADCDIYPIIEGVSGTGIVCANASFTRIQGGTSEGNAKGITFSSTSYLNQIYGTDFESNTTSDIEDAGNNNQYFGSRAASNAPVQNVLMTGNGASFHGGYVRHIQTNAAAFTGTITTNTTLTVAGIGAQLITLGQALIGVGVLPGCVIVAFGSGTGGNGTYTITSNPNVGPEAMTTAASNTAYFGTDFSDNGGLGIQGNGTIAARVGCTRSSVASIVTLKYSDLVGERGIPFTPAVSSAGGGAQGAGTVTASYTVAGQKCLVTMTISVAQGTLGAGSISITGLPFQAQNTAGLVQCLPLQQWGNNIALGAGYTSISLQIAPGGTTASLIKSGTGVAPAVVNLADFTGTMVLYCTGEYQTV